MDNRAPRVLPPLRLALGAGALLLAATAQAGQIWTCVDAQGRKYTSDRWVPECAGLPHSAKNTDGSTKGVIPPPMTEDEKAAADAKARAAAQAETERRVKERADLALVRKYPSPEAHAVARAKELEDVRMSIKTLERRGAELVAERKRLADEEEFYIGKPLPGKLKTAIDATEAQMGAQKQMMEDRQAELSRVNTRFDVQLAELKVLWAARR
jgi:hypothetical protein